ncbi:MULTISPECIES: acyltransferase family protein [unclassified Vibrio]|uniref:acyltransferase family protein n=1 Tax=unclassified Vibrio TaxID=2614977 RepID=UPI00354FD81D
MKFRSDINALRALAVVSVVFFHFTPNLLPGGFIGVDIFFVISGFLMTSIIMGKLQQGCFSFTNFYAARLARIVPALIILLIVLLVIGWFYLAPQSLDTLAQQIRYSATFTSNLLFHEQAGYFDSVSRDKWLLHTWSLSVEWQFYIIYPIYLVLTARYLGHKNVLFAINVLIILSLTFCIYSQFNGDNSYFLLQARAWEMMLGSWAYFWKPSCKIPASVGWFGLIISLVLIDETKVWPSLWTLLPTISALLVLVSAKRSRLAEITVVQKIGLSSYSIYLWHWPVVVLFYKLGLNENVHYLIGILTSVAVGYISYLTVEQVQFRRDFQSAKQLLLGSTPVLGVVIVVLVAKAINSNDGFTTRATLDKELTQVYEQLKREKQKSPKRKECHRNISDQIAEPCYLFSEDPSWAIIGDSHAAELAYSMAEKLKVNDNGIAQYTFANCPPSFKQKDDFSACTHWTNIIVNDIAQNKGVDKVVIAFRYSMHLYGDNEKTYPELPKEHTDSRRDKILNSLNQTLNLLSSAGKKVYMIMPVPEMGQSVQTLIDKAAMRSESLTNIESAPLTYTYKRNETINRFIQEYSEEDNKAVHMIDIEDIFCGKFSCYAVREGAPLYYDHNHPGLPVTGIIATRVLNRANQ